MSCNQLYTHQTLSQATASEYKIDLQEICTHIQKRVAASDNIQQKRVDIFNCEANHKPVMAYHDLYISGNINISGMIRAHALVIDALVIG